MLSQQQDASDDGLGKRASSWHARPSLSPPWQKVKMKDMTAAIRATCDAAAADEHRRKWLELEVQRLRNRSDGLESQLTSSQADAAAMQQKITQLEALLDVVGSQASKALDEQCVQLEKELDLQDTHLTHLSGMQQSLALADQQHAKVLRQRNAQIRVLQQKLTAAQQLLQEQDAAFARSAERLARLDRVHGLNRQLESKITRLKAELATRESELEHAQMLLQQEADKAHAHRIDEAATREAFHHLIARVNAVALQAAVALNLLQQALADSPVEQLPSAIWVSGFTQSVQVLGTLLSLKRTTEQGFVAQLDGDFAAVSRGGSHGQLIPAQQQSGTGNSSSSSSSSYQLKAARSCTGSLGRPVSSSTVGSLLINCNQGKADHRWGSRAASVGTARAGAAGARALATSEGRAKSGCRPGNLGNWTGAVRARATAGDAVRNAAVPWSSAVPTSGEAAGTTAAGEAAAAQPHRASTAAATAEVPSVGGQNKADLTDQCADVPAEKTAASAGAAAATASSSLAPSRLPQVAAAAAVCTSELAEEAAAGRAGRLDCVSLGLADNSDALAPPQLAVFSAAASEPAKERHTGAAASVTTSGPRQVAAKILALETAAAAAAANAGLNSPRHKPATMKVPAAAVATGSEAHCSRPEEAARPSDSTEPLPIEAAAAGADAQTSKASAAATNEAAAAAGASANASDPAKLLPSAAVTLAVASNASKWERADAGASLGEAEGAALESWKPQTTDSTAATPCATPAVNAALAAPAVPAPAPSAATAQKIPLNALAEEIDVAVSTEAGTSCTGAAPEAAGAAETAAIAEAAGAAETAAGMGVDVAEAAAALEPVTASSSSSPEADAGKCNGPEVQASQAARDPDAHASALESAAQEDFRCDEVEELAAAEIAAGSGATCAASQPAAAHNSTVMAVATPRLQSDTTTSAESTEGQPDAQAPAAAAAGCVRKLAALNAAAAAAAGVSSVGQSHDMQDAATEACAAAAAEAALTDHSAAHTGLVTSANLEAAGAAGQSSGRASCPLEGDATTHLPLIKASGRKIDHDEVLLPSTPNVLAGGQDGPPVLAHSPRFTRPFLTEAASL